MENQHHLLRSSELKATYLNVYIEKFKVVDTATQLISLSYTKSGTRGKGGSFWKNQYRDIAKRENFESLKGNIFLLNYLFVAYCK